LKPQRQGRAGRMVCRAPRGARGLKLAIEMPRRYALESRPARGAWIETLPNAF